MVVESDKVKIERMCVHCDCTWDEFVTREQLRLIAQNKPIGKCPNPACELPT